MGNAAIIGDSPLLFQKEKMPVEKNLLTLLLLLKNKTCLRKKSVLLTKEDHAAILYYLRNHSVLHAADRESANALQQELKKSPLLDENELPAGGAAGQPVKSEGYRNQCPVGINDCNPDRANLKEKNISSIAIGNRPYRFLPWCHCEVEGAGRGKIVFD